MVALSASHSRAADSTSVCRTVCRSKVERLIILSTSAVAVCCCNDSRSSFSNPSVLDRYCGLIRERLQKSNMLVLERTYFGASHQDRTKRVALSNQRHAKDGAMAPFERELPSQWELSPCVLQISYMYGLLVTNGPPHNSCAVKRHRFPVSQEAANFAD